MNKRNDIVSLPEDAAGADADGLGTYNYQWQRSTDGGTTWSNVGVNAATHLLGDAGVGSVIRVNVSYTDDQGYAESLTSTQTTAIASVNDAPTGGPAITGTTTEDQTLTADTSSIADADGLGSFAYQWQRSTDGGSTWTQIGGTFDARNLSVETSYDFIGVLLGPYVTTK